MSAIAIGDTPEYGSPYRAGAANDVDLPTLCCGEEHVFGPCAEPDCSGHTLVCTAPEGHLADDIPHIASGFDLGVVGLWDNSGRQVLGQLDDDTNALKNVGATL